MPKKDAILRHVYPYVKQFFPLSLTLFSPLHLHIYPLPRHHSIFHNYIYNTPVLTWRFSQGQADGPWAWSAPRHPTASHWQTTPGTKKILTYMTIDDKYRYQQKRENDKIYIYNIHICIYMMTKYGCTELQTYGRRVKNKMIHINMYSLKTMSCVPT